MPDAFHGRVPGLIWPDEGFHSPWIDFQGPHQDFLWVNDVLVMSSSPRVY
jgi:hypothetical protein